VNTLPLSSLSRYASFSLKANQRKELAAGWLPKVFSVSQPAPATYCTPRCSGANLGSWSAILRSSGQQEANKSKSAAKLPSKILYLQGQARWAASFFLRLIFLKLK
jgi:hypothetical protein